MPILAGALIAAGLSLMLRRTAFTLFVGLVILSHGVNLLIFLSGGLTRGQPPVLAEHREPGALADPLPQALILTAIVIGLGVQTFLLTLVFRLATALRTPDLDVARHTEPGEPNEAGTP